jgi:hypothetical protein
MMTEQVIFPEGRNDPLTGIERLLRQTGKICQIATDALLICGSMEERHRQ